mmetsp:Transcript_124/g.380  ORF Transcript_124/g.380 Transcript_124/m.380 type:complete len:410 (-) Transcript_124:194-1423(-)
MRHASMVAVLARTVRRCRLHAAHNFVRAASSSRSTPPPADPWRMLQLGFEEIQDDFQLLLKRAPQARPTSTRLGSLAALQQALCRLPTGAPIVTVHVSGWLSAAHREWLAEHVPWKDAASKQKGGQLLERLVEIAARATTARDAQPRKKTDLARQRHDFLPLDPLLRLNSLAVERLRGPLAGHLADLTLDGIDEEVWLDEKGIDPRVQRGHLARWASSARMALISCEDALGAAMAAQASLRERGLESEILCQGFSLDGPKGSHGRLGSPELEFLGYSFRHLHGRRGSSVGLCTRPSMESQKLLRKALKSKLGGRRSSSYDLPELVTAVVNPILRQWQRDFPVDTGFGGRRKAPERVVAHYLHGRLLQWLKAKHKGRPVATLYARLQQQERSALLTITPVDSFSRASWQS